MCGLAGIMFKTGGSSNDTGKALIDMLDGCQHRGPDSTGFALYATDTEEDRLHLRFYIGPAGTAQGQKITEIKGILAKHGAPILKDEVIGDNYRCAVEFTGDLQKMSYDLEHVASIISIGSSLEIYKDVGSAHQVNDRYNVHEIKGTHGLGHVRMATESAVSPESAHPFWATGFSDVAIVHNGQITNYFKLRRRLERRGYEFHTDNDSELIAIYLADQLKHGVSLRDALGQSIEDLDGTFSYLASTKDEIGYAKDRLAVKPMIMYEDDDIIAIASEEVSINRLFPGKPLDTREPPPGTYMTWSR